MIELLWIKFRLKSFLELHVHFNGFMCIRIRKLHAEYQNQADACDWSLIVLSFSVPNVIRKKSATKKLSQLFGWSVRTLAQYSTPYNYLAHVYCVNEIFPFYLFSLLNYIILYDVTSENKCYPN